MKAMPLALVIAAGVNSAIGNLLLKWSRVAAAPGATTLEKLLSVGFLGGLFFYAVNVVLFAKALDDMPVSIAYPILAGVGFALLALASSMIFAEALTLSKALGIGLILLGIVALARTG